MKLMRVQEFLWKFRSNQKSLTWFTYKRSNQNVCSLSELPTNLDPQKWNVNICTLFFFFLLPLSFFCSLFAAYYDFISILFGFLFSFHFVVAIVVAIAATAATATSAATTPSTPKITVHVLPLESASNKIVYGNLVRCRCEPNCSHLTLSHSHNHKQKVMRTKSEDF